VKRPGFLHGVAAALVLAFFASASVAALTPFVGFYAVLRLVIPLLGLAYLLYLFSRSNERTGRVTTLLAWSVIAASSWWLALPLPLYLCVHAGAVWLVRSLYFHSGPVGALLDLGLAGLSLAAAAWAIAQSGSVFLATWCFFLVQALFVTIPSGARPARRVDPDTTGDNDNFDKARRQAEQALGQLFTQ
jgi:hypothetical protein